MNVSSFFQGSALKFSLAGDGVSFDPATGELGLSSEALRAGFTVIVTAEPADGGAAQSFKLRVAAEPAAAAPVLLTAPVLVGSGLIGAGLEVVPGTWGGQPAPQIALQWLRGGVEIAGETGARYLPQPADDGQEITCRVTAENASGALSAEPEAVRAVQAAPLAVGVLADVSVEKGAAALSVAAAAAFAGEGLSFAVTGGGAAIDPVTGVLGLPTDVTRDGETVTVTATNSGGQAAASFRVSVIAVVVIELPALLAAPTLEGVARIGGSLTVATGLWSGLPLLSLQWLRDGAEIDGAAAAAYVPVHADDRCALSCRVTATNGAGSVAVETAALTASYAAPTRVGELFEEILDQGTGPETIATAAVFAGENLSFAVTGAGATIDAATGLLTLSTETALSQTVTVTATNSGGQAAASFLLTVEAPEFPEFLADSAWSVKEVRDAAPVGRRQVSIAAGVVPAGFELCFYTGPAEGRTNTDWRRVMRPGETYTTSSSMKIGTACYNRLFWRRVADGAWAEASNEILIPIAGLAGGGDGGGDTGGEASLTLAAATPEALKSALDARIAGASAAEWIIDLPNGNYGNLNLGGRQMPGKTVIRSQNRALGAKFSGIEMSGCRNIVFQFVDVDRSLGGAGNYGVKMRPANHCGIEYSRIYVGPIETHSDKRGWKPNCNYAVEINSMGSDLATFCAVRMNLISGVCDKHVYINGATDCEILDNVGENVGTDFVMHGWGHRNKFLRNWGPRAYYPDFNVDTGWSHNDFMQVYSMGVTSQDLVFHDNVIMLGPLGFQPNPRQALFSSKSYGSGWDYEGNIICTNSAHGITAGPNMSAMRARNNTVLRCIDAQGEQNIVQFSINGAIELSRNVQCGLSGNKSMGADGLNIVMPPAGSFTNSLAYYTAPYLASGFYDLRPVAGAVTHGDYAKGTPLGAHQRFRDVIVGGAYPKIGPAAAAWKTWYDPRNQITS